MKVTRKQLKRIIREESERLISEHLKQPSHAINEQQHKFLPPPEALHLDVDDHNHPEHEYWAKQIPNHPDAKWAIHVFVDGVDITETMEGADIYAAEFDTWKDARDELQATIDSPFN